jgi:hypothetical protein
MFEKEEDLEKATQPFFERQFKSFARQVPIYNRLIDAVAVDWDDNVFGIEFKLKNWRRAIAQCKANINALDFAYICVPKSGFLPQLRTLAMENGIGLFVFDAETNEVEVDLRAVRNDHQWGPNHRYLLSVLTEGGET